MKTILPIAALALALTLLPSHAAEAGYADFGKLVGPQKGEFVEVTLGQGVLKLAAFIARQRNAEAAQLIGGLSRVRVNVVGLDDTNRENTSARITAVRADLARDGWEQIVAARGKNQEDIAVFLKQRDGEIIDGVVVTVMDKRKQQAVLVNVVGHIKAEQLAMLGEHLDIPVLKNAPPARKV